MELHHGDKQPPFLGKLQDEIFLFAVGGLYLLRPLVDGDAVFIVDDPLSRNEPRAPVARRAVLDPPPGDGDAGEFKVGHHGALGIAVDKAFAQYSLAGLKAVDPRPLEVAFRLRDDLYPVTVFDHRKAVAFYLFKFAAEVGKLHDRHTRGAVFYVRQDAQPPVGGETGAELLPCLPGHAVFAVEALPQPDGVLRGRIEPVRIKEEYPHILGEIVFQSVVGL